MKAFFIAISIFLPVLCVAQSTDGHKTYSGSFPKEYSYGKAMYSYLTSDDGNRIFDGSFKYNSEFESLEGNFKNNRQVGKWILSRPNNSHGPKALVKTVTTVDFGENGYLDGHFKIQEYYRNGTIIDIMDATYRNGRLTGPFKGKDSEGTFSGQYKNSIPVGKWKYSWIDNPVDFDKADSFGHVPVKHVNPATGDVREVFQSMPTYPEYKGRPRGWWIENMQLRDSRSIAFAPMLNAEMQKIYNGRYRWEGKRIRGFEGGAEVAYLLEFDIPNNLLNSYNDGLRGGWSDWEDFLLLNCELPIEEIGDKPVTVNLLIDVDGEGNVNLIEKDDAVSDKLNEEALRLLRKLQWSFGESDLGNIEEKAKKGLRAFCDVDVTFDPAKMRSNLEVFNERKRKKQEKLEAEKRYEESFAPITDAIQDKSSGAEDKIYDNPDEMPQFPGGQAGLAQFLSRTVHYPASAAENFIQGKVVVGFVVRKDGTVSDVKILRGRDKDLNQEAMRIVKAMPKFKPGKVKGQPVNVAFSIPINFRL